MEVSRSPLLEVRNLTKVFKIGGVILGTKLTAVDSVNLNVESGKPKIVSLVGESGCGKTTLARMILRIVEPTNGEVIVEGKNVFKLKRKSEIWFRRTVQPIFQNPYEAFNPLRKVDNCLHSTAIKLHLAAGKEKAKEVVSESLSSVGLDLEQVTGKIPREFSGGELQRLSVARALIPRPKLVIADEPMSSVDASIRMNIVNLFIDLKRKFDTVFLYITHDLSTAYYMSDSIAIMYRGSIVEYGSANAVLEKPLHPYTETLSKSIPDIGRKWQDKIKLSDTEIKEFEAAGCKFSFRCPYAKSMCKQKRPHLVALEDEREVACFKYAESG